MTKETLMKNIFQWGILTAITVAAMPEAAMAITAGNAVANFTKTDVVQAPPLVSAIAYVIGAVLGVSGALKLKAHAEKPDQEKLAPGIGRLLAGGAIAALPTLVQTAFETLHIGNEGIGYSEMNIGGTP